MPLKFRVFLPSHRQPVFMFLLKCLTNMIGWALILLKSIQNYKIFKEISIKLLGLIHWKSTIFPMAYGRKMRLCVSDPSFFFTQSTYNSLYYRRISIYFQISGFVDSIVPKSKIYKDKFNIQLRTNSDRYYEVLAKSNESFR